MKGAMSIMKRPTPVRPLSERGRIYYPEDIVELYRGKRTRDWVIRHFAPEFRQKDGKLVYWWECDVTRYFDDVSAA